MEYQLIRSRRKTLAIQLPDSCQVVVRAPLRMPVWQIEAFLREKQGWILEHQAKLRLQQEERQRLLAMERGLYYLGALYPAVADASGNRALFDGQSFHLPSLARQEQEAALVSLYRALTRELVVPLMAQWAPLLGVQPRGVTITSAMGRWGSCSGKGRLCFPYRLATQPRAAVEYVVVHELCHLRELNHGSAFWALVQGCLPDWRQRRGLLSPRFDRMGEELRLLQTQAMPDTPAT